MNMKTIQFFFATLLMVFVLASCSSDSGEGGQKQPDPQDESTQVEVNISVLMGADNYDHPVPRLLAEWGDNMFAQVVDPAHPELTMFQYINNDKGGDIVAVVSEHNIIFMHYNPLTDKDFPKEALIASDDDDFSSLSSCTVDWKNNEIKYDKTVPFNQNTKTRTRGENDLIKKPFFDMFDEMSANISKIKEKMEVFGTLGKSATLLCDIWTEGLIPVMKYQLYDDDKLAQQQYVQDYFTGKTMDYIKGKINGKVDEGMDKATDYLCKVTGVNKEHVNMGVWAYDNVIRPKLMTDEKPTEKTEQLVSSGMQAALDFSKKVVAAAPIFNETQDVPDEDDPEWWDEEEDDDEWGDEDEDEYIAGWTGTTWDFEGNMTIDDTDDGKKSFHVTFMVEFPKSGGVEFSGEMAELFADGKTKVEKTGTSVTITNTGTFTDNDSERTYTQTWNFTLTVNRRSANSATMTMSGKDVWNGAWNETIYKDGKKIGTITHPYSGTTTYSGSFTGTRVE